MSVRSSGRTDPESSRGPAENASVEDALDRLYLLYKIEKAIDQADRGELISQKEACQRMAKWLK